MLPEHAAIGRRDADGTKCAGEHNLGDASDDGHVWRAVTVAAVRTHPPRSAIGERIRSELTANGGDDQIVDHEWRAGKAPHRRGRVEIGHHVSRPEDPAVARVESVQEAGRSECQDAIGSNRGGRTRPGTAHRLLEPHTIGVAPHERARRNPVSADGFVAASLLLGVQNVVADRERRPAGANAPAPQLNRRSRRPVGVDLQAADDSSSIGSSEPGPVREPLDSGRPGRFRQ